jgi:protein associated with RNAse G/E
MSQSISRKHNGDIAKIFHSMKILCDRPDVIVQYSDIGARVDVVNKDTHWIAHYSAYKIYPKDAWYNFIIVEKEEGNEYYCNMASPPEVDADGNVSYIDYDVDVVLTPKGEIEIHDEDQFAERIKIYGYSDDLVTKVREKTIWLFGALEAREGYFSPAFYTEMQILKDKNIK